MNVATYIQHVLDFQRHAQILSALCGSFHRKAPKCKSAKFFGSIFEMVTNLKDDLSMNITVA